MYVLTGFNDEVIFVSEDLTYDVCNNPEMVLLPLLVVW